VTGKPNLSFYSDIRPSKYYTHVVHCKKSDYDVYIGRPSKWGNPFSHKEGTIAEFKVNGRAEAIKKYEEWVLTQPHLMSSLIELRGKTLGCWCSPKPCHGNVLSKLVERYVD
jgi:hypothetical protein